MPSGGIVFASNEGKVFALNPVGNELTLLTPKERVSWDPSVCGDGRYIVYSANQEQRRGIWRMDADGSNPIRIADETFAIGPQCSPNGKWVVYLRGPSGTPTRVNITGEKPPETLSQDLADWSGVVAISPDGQRIAYLVGPSGSKPVQLNIIPSGGGASLYRFDWPALAGGPRWLGGGARWAPGGEAVDYVLTRNGVSNVWRQKLSGGAPKQITNFESGQILDFDWSRNGRQLALTRGSESSDVILISNFR